MKDNSPELAISEDPHTRRRVKVMDATVWREKVVFTRRRNLDKFLKMWKPWLKKMGCPP